MKCGLVWAENAGQQMVRKQPRVRLCLLAVLPCVLVIAGFTPHIITGEVSLEAAGETCKDSGVNRIWENEADKYDLTSLEDAVEYMNRHATNDLHVQHELNIAATAMSLAGFLLWVFFTAHSASSATRLDLTRMPPPSIPPPHCRWVFTACLYPLSNLLSLSLSLPSSLCSWKFSFFASGGKPRSDGF
jgi:hypothetical protein